MARVIGEGRDRLPEALVAGPAKDDRVVLARGPGDGGGAGLGGELLGGGEAATVIAELGQELGRIDLPAARQALHERAVGVIGQGGGDGGRELLDLGDQRDQDRDQAADQFAPGVALGLARAADRAPRKRPSSSAAGRRPQ